MIRQNPSGFGALNSDCGPPSISADGRYVAFEAGLADDPGRHTPEVVLRDRVERTARRITVGPAGSLSNGWSGQAVIDASATPAIDASGAVVAFASRHPISTRDVLNDFDLFVRSRLE